MTRARQYSFDSECLRLARHFNPGPEEENDLAQAIQDAVEDYFAEMEEPRGPT